MSNVGFGRQIHFHCLLYHFALTCGLAVTGWDPQREAVPILTSRPSAPRVSNSDSLRVTSQPKPLESNAGFKLKGSTSTHLN